MEAINKNFRQIAPIFLLAFLFSACSGLSTGHSFDPVYSSVTGKYSLEERNLQEITPLGETKVDSDTHFAPDNYSKTKDDELVQKEVSPDQIERYRQKAADQRNNYSGNKYTTTEKDDRSGLGLQGTDPQMTTPHITNSPPIINNYYRGSYFQDSYPFYYWNQPFSGWNIWGPNWNTYWYGGNSLWDLNVLYNPWGGWSYGIGYNWNWGRIGYYTPWYNNNVYWRERSSNTQSGRKVVKGTTKLRGNSVGRTQPSGSRQDKYNSRYNEEYKQRSTPSGDVQQSRTRSERYAKPKLNIPERNNNPSYSAPTRSRSQQYAAPTKSGTPSRSKNYSQPSTPRSSSYGGNRRTGSSSGDSGSKTRSRSSKY